MKNILIFSLLFCLSACDDEKSAYMKRHSDNFDKKHIVRPGKWGNPIRRHPYSIPSQYYDAEDFRAGAMDVCGMILEEYGKDLCEKYNYWGYSGPRL